MKEVKILCFLEPEDKLNFPKMPPFSWLNEENVFLAYSLVVGKRKLFVGSKGRGNDMSFLTWMLVKSSEFQTIMYLMNGKKSEFCREPSREAVVIQCLSRGHLLTASWYKCLLESKSFTVKGEASETVKRPSGMTQLFYCQTLNSEPSQLCMSEEMIVSYERGNCYAQGITFCSNQQ